MEPLGVINYVRNNNKRLIATIIIVSFSSFLLYFTFGLGSAIKYDLIDGMVEPYRSMTRFYPFNKEVSERTLEKLKSMNEVDKIIACRTEQTNVDTIVGMAGATIFIVNKENVEPLLDKMDLKLISGTYAEKENELMVNEKVLRGMNKEVGDYVGEDVDKSSKIKGKYKIVGAFSGISKDFIACDKEENKKGLLLVFAKSNEQKSVNRYLESLNKEEVNVESLEDREDAVGNMKPMLYSIGAIVCFVFVIVLSIIMWNIIYINMVARKKEISLLMAVGYSNKFIKKRVFKENGISFLIAAVLGNIFGVVGLKIFYELYCYPKGFDMKIFSPVYLLATFLVPLLVLIISVIPIWRGIKRIEPINVLEGNI